MVARTLESVAGGSRVHRAQGPESSLLVEKGVEDRRAVEPWEAQPVDHAIHRDQSGRMSVGEQCVFSMLEKGLGRCLSLDSDSAIVRPFILRAGFWNPA